MEDIPKQNNLEQAILDMALSYTFLDPLKRHIDMGIGLYEL